MFRECILKRMLGIFTGFFFVFGIPMIINWAYNYGSSHTPVFITSWGAEDVLSYYGSVLGAVITGLSLYVTIRFTKKQNQYDKISKSGSKKWTKIEDIIGSILDKINPIPIIIQEMDSGFTDPDKALTLFQKYQMSCRGASDQLISCVNIVDYRKIAELVKHITDTADQFFQLSDKKIDQYSKLHRLKERENTLKLLAIEKKCPGSLSVEEIEKYQKIIEDTKCICLEDIENEMRQINKEFVHIYDTNFKPLLQYKGATFEMIHTQIQKNADEILSLWRK